MTSVSQKCQYALRAILELARREDEAPVKVWQIAEAQAIPARFLEAILSQLRQGGFVTSRRGLEGGYLPARSPRTLTVGEVIRFIEGPLAPVDCVAGGSRPDCPLYGRCAFMDMWRRAGDAVAEVYDSTTFQDLLEAERLAAETFVPDFCI